MSRFLDATEIRHIAMPVWLFAIGAFAALSRREIGDIEPGDPLFMKITRLGNMGVWIIECTDVDVDDRAFSELALPGQRGSALVAEAAFHPRRGIVNAALAPAESDLVGREKHQRDDRRPGVPPAAMAVAVADLRRLPDGLVAHRAAHAAAGNRHRFFTHDYPL